MFPNLMYSVFGICSIKFANQPVWRFFIPYRFILDLQIYGTARVPSFNLIKFYCTPLSSTNLPDI